MDISFTSGHAAEVGLRLHKQPSPEHSYCAAKTPDGARIVTSKHMSPAAPIREQFTPRYLALLQSDELAARVSKGLEKLADCALCPRGCHVERSSGELAVCHCGRHARVSSYFPHFGEEDCLRGTKGSGTIFFSGCNLRCVFCQNFDVSWQVEGEVVSPDRLARMMLELQACGCHNINLVTPEHVVPQILEALLIAAKGGLRLPLVYNTGAYDGLDSVRLMDGIVDIYMPDFKIWDPEMARRYLRAADYPETARQAIREMHRQVGPLIFDGDGVARRGLLLRHLVMPGDICSTGEIMRWVACELGTDTYVNVMPQYRPSGKVRSAEYPEINRYLRQEEFRRAITAAREAGLFRLEERSALHATMRWSC